METDTEAAALQFGNFQLRSFAVHQLYQLGDFCKSKSLQQQWNYFTTTANAAGTMPGGLKFVSTLTFTTA